MSSPSHSDNPKKTPEVAMEDVPEFEYPDGGGLWDEQWGAPPYIMSTPSSMLPVSYEAPTISLPPISQTPSSPAPAPPPPHPHMKPRRRFSSHKPTSLLQKAAMRAAHLRKQEIERIQANQQEQIQAQNLGKDIVNRHASNSTSDNAAIDQQGLRASVTTPPSPSKSARPRKRIKEKRRFEIRKYYQNNKECTHKEVAEKFNYSGSAISKA